MRSRTNLTGTLLDNLSDELRIKLEAHEDYANALGTFDFLKLYNIVEQIVLGRGSVSIYQAILRIINLKQTPNEYVRFQNTFSDAAYELQKIAENDPDNGYKKIVNKFLDVLFILGVDQTEFKDKLTPVYGEKEWPGWETFMRTLYNSNAEFSTS